VRPHQASGGCGRLESTGCRGGRVFEYLAVSDTIHLVSDNERSVVEPEPTFLKAIIDHRTWHLFECLVVGDHAAVIANSASIAIGSGLSDKNLRNIPLAQSRTMEALVAIVRKLD
jgi:pyruvate/2-oxoglutarate dehydrogenase complex dihydrolipoamide dehydrogenase (E3) component